MMRLDNNMEDAKKEYYLSSAIVSSNKLFSKRMKNIKSQLEEDLSSKILGVSAADWDKNVPKGGKKLLREQSNMLSIMSSNQ